MPATAGVVLTHSTEAVLWSGILETTPDPEPNLTPQQSWTRSPGGRVVASTESREVNRDKRPYVLRITIG